MKSPAFKLGMVGAVAAILSLFGFAVFAQTAGESASPPPPPSATPPSGQTSAATQQPSSGANQSTAPSGASGSTNIDSGQPPQPAFSGNNPPPPRGGNFSDNPSQGNWQPPYAYPNQEGHDNPRKMYQEGQSSQYPSDQNYGNQNFRNQDMGRQNGQNFNDNSRPPMMPNDRFNPNQKMNQPGPGNQSQFQGRPEQGDQREMGNFNQNQNGGSNNQNGSNFSDQNEQEQNARDAEQQKREEQMVKRQAAQMAKMLTQTVNQINKRIAALKKQGMPLTQECSDTVSAFTDAAAKAKNATSQDDLYDLQDVMQSMSDLNDCRQIIERLISAPKILKSATNTVNRLKRRKVDVSEAEPALSELVNRFNQLKSGTPTTNDDVENFFDSMDNLGDIVAPLMDGNAPESKMQGASVFEGGGGLWDSILSWFGF